MSEVSGLVKVAVVFFIGVIAGAFLVIGALIGLFASLVIMGILFALFIIVFLIALVVAIVKRRG